MEEREEGIWINDANINDRLSLFSIIYKTLRLDEVSILYFEDKPIIEKLDSFYFKLT